MDVMKRTMGCRENRLLQGAVTAAHLHHIVVL